MRHKYYVLAAGLTVGAPLWRLLVHDFSKLLPCEWLPYARSFYNADGSNRNMASRSDEEKAAFDRAWLHHIHANPHHHQHWVLRNDDGTTRALEIPDAVVRELCADWASAGKCITGKWEFMEWYSKNKDKMILHPNTRSKVEYYLQELHMEITGYETRKCTSHSYAE